MSPYQFLLIIYFVGILVSSSLHFQHFGNSDTFTFLHIHIRLYTVHIHNIVWNTTQIFTHHTQYTIEKSFSFFRFIGFEAGIHHTLRCVHSLFDLIEMYARNCCTKIPKKNILIFFFAFFEFRNKMGLLLWLMDAKSSRVYHTWH